ncbi:hypothetical protein SAMN05660330_04388 [Desulforhopalus singaporensis]|uniref:Uncharacterized protein n=1 Tax=Desulforhopalus singaporensis TaxID=91360 RepID=A0A1H0W2F7_9BACT|nr:hypothetical protein SAMN05660330_04388 [Desulforhopalus singaporensis]
MQEQLLILHYFPESFNKKVVSPPPLAFNGFNKLKCSQRAPLAIGIYFV